MKNVFAATKAQNVWYYLNQPLLILIGQFSIVRRKPDVQRTAVTELTTAVSLLQTLQYSSFLQGHDLRVTHQCGGFVHVDRYRKGRPHGRTAQQS